MASPLFTNHKVPSPASYHVLDGFMAFAAELGVHDLTPQWNIPAVETDNDWAKQNVQQGKTDAADCSSRQ